jgi:hypothetical protein
VDDADVDALFGLSETEKKVIASKYAAIYRPSSQALTPRGDDNLIGHGPCFTVHGYTGLHQLRIEPSPMRAPADDVS